MAVEECFDYKFAPGSEPCSDHICPVTNKIMLDPYQTGCCGHHLSSSVAERLTRERKSCPLCNAPSPPADGSVSSTASSSRQVFTVTRDKFFQKKILELQVLCPHEERGCVWVGAVRDVQSHALSCDMKPCKCQYCDFETTQLVGITEHAQNCLKRPMECTCSADVIPFCELDDHLKTCPDQPVPCEFQYVGCQSEVLRKDLPQHLKEDISHHQLLVSQQSLKMMMELNAKFDRNEAVPPEAMERAAVAECSDEADRLQNIVEMREQEVVTLKEELKRKEETIAKKEEKIRLLESKSEDEKNSIESVVAQHQHLVEKKEAEIHLLRVEKRETSERLIQMEQSDDDKELRAESVPMGKMTMESLQQIVDGLRHKKSMSKKEVSILVSQLEEVLAQSEETLSSDGFTSDSSSGGYPPFCNGKFERVVIDGLKKPWGLAVSRGKVYAVDNGGSYGLHIASTHDQEKSVETMIPAASISEVTTPPGKCWYPKGVALDKDSNIILVDNGTHRVLKFSPHGKQLAAIGSECVYGNTSGTFNSPNGVAISPKGNIFVCDRFNHRVQVLGPELQFVKEFGERGSGPEQFTNPWDVAFDKQGNVYIADCGNGCVKVFTPDLKPSRVIGKGKGKYKKGDLRAPSSLCIDSNGFLYVADIRFKQVLVYDATGKFRCNFGKFVDPHGIAVDRNNQVYVSDNGGGTFPLQASGRVQMFS